VLYNRFLLVRFKNVSEVIGGRQTYSGFTVYTQPTIEFDCTHTKKSSPNEATLRLFNVAPATQHKLFTAGAKVEIEAGYWPQDEGAEQNFGVIFKGQIREVRTYIDNGTDTVSELKLGDGDDAARVSRGRAKFPKGTSHKIIVDSLVTKLPDVVVGKIEVPNYIEPRPFMCDKGAWRSLEDIAHQHNLNWGVQDGVVNMTAADKPLVDSGIILSPRSGVIDAPEFTHEGVEIKTLLLHYLRPGYTFILRNDDVQRLRAPEKYCIEEIRFSGSNNGDDFGCSITSKLVGNDGKIKPSRNRNKNRAV
jgi:hypothetical protein